ncbi:hypothetical protein [Aquimarina algicola]|uniref:Uncharacterized protein n=1 Tax=Aquimarina algicola TaxID=2589995 RepID=A0A504J002_9FLAO|nr:hypothetical protein [Aquimarina algicola]TPN81338.1 hypothetical protein FHK87_25465 [Aquimarina algicola]
MKINWLSKSEAKSSEVQKLLKLEYNFRKKATIILLELMDNKEWVDLSSVEFDFCTEKHTFLVSKNTPEPIYSYLSTICTATEKANIPWSVGVIS